MTRRSALLAGAVCAAVATCTTLPALAAVTAVSPGTAMTPATGRQSALSAAQALLAQADSELQLARMTAHQVRLEALSGTMNRATLERVNAPTPAEDPGSDIQLVASLIDPADPDGALRTLGVADLTAVAPVARPATTQPVTTPQEALVRATQNVRIAHTRQVAARSLVRQIENPARAGGPGAAQLVTACADAGITASICQPVDWDEDHLLRDSVVIERLVHVKWPQIRVVGGWRPSDPYPDHPSGRAVDIMMPHGGTGSDVALGNEIARYFQQHAREFGIYYMIWRQRQWKTGSAIGDWSAMSDRGSPTANHMDHVHITVADGHSGTAFRTLLNRARPGQ